MKRYTGVLLGTALVLLTVIGAGALLSGHPHPVAASHAKRSDAERTVHALRMEVIVKSPNFGYFQTILAGAKKAAAQFGVQSLAFTGPNADSNVAGQVRLVEDAIARHPDFIVLAPTAVGALNSPVAQAHRAGIKVIIIDVHSLGVPPGVPSACPTATPGTSTPTPTMPTLRSSRSWRPTPGRREPPTPTLSESGSRIAGPTVVLKA
jgi:ABC-type sugar transport system substrate-binding protein